MKKKILLFLATIVLCSISELDAQNAREGSRWDNWIMIDAGGYVAADGAGYWPHIGLELGYKYDDKLFLGLGSGFSYIIEGIEGGTSKSFSVPVYALARYYVPMGRAVSFAADVQTGISLNHDDRNVCGFYCSPNVGLSFKTGKCGALDLMFGYRF